jgi:hypothetical protein
MANFKSDSQSIGAENLEYEFAKLNPHDEFLPRNANDTTIVLPQI